MPRVKPRAKWIVPSRVASFCRECIRYTDRFPNLAYANELVRRGRILLASSSLKSRTAIWRALISVRNHTRVFHPGFTITYNSHH